MTFPRATGSQPAALPAEGDAPPCPELLADAVERLDGLDDPAMEEVCHLLRARPLVARELRRREALRMVALARADDPHASLVALSRLVAHRLAVPAETVRWWARGVDSTRGPGDAQAEREA